MRREPAAPVALAGAAAFLTLYATQPLLPLLARSFGASPFAVGLTVTAPTVAVAIAAPAIGRFADNIGLRRVIVVSAFLLAVTAALQAASQTLGQFVFWRLVQGIVTPGVFACTVAYVHEMWPASRAGRGAAIYMTGTIVGGFVGRALAGVIAADADWHISFAVLAVMHVAIAMVLWLWLPAEPARSAPAPREPARLESRTSTGPDGSPRSGGASVALRLFRNPQLRATYAIGFCVLFTNVAMFTYVTFHLAAPPFRLSTAALGWLFVVYLVGAAVTPYGGKWIDAYGHRVGIATAMSLGGVGALLTLAPSVAVIIVGLAMTACGVFIAQTTTSSYIGAVTTGDRALAVGLYATFYYLGGSVGGSVPAAFYRIGGWPACVALVVAVQAFGATVALALWQTRVAAAEYEPDIEAVP
jgi:MFS family permease